VKVIVSSATVNRILAVVAADLVITLTTIKNCSR
jgi:hypothetical protein